MAERQTRGQENGLRTAAVEAVRQRFYSLLDFAVAGSLFSVDRAGRNAEERGGLGLVAAGVPEGLEMTSF